MRLERMLRGRGEQAVGLVRDADQAEDLRAAGAEPHVVDLETASVQDVAQALAGADAAVFAAGAGPGSGAERKDTVDRAGAALLADAAEAAGTRRFLLVSARGADQRPPADADPVFAAYLRAKAAAEADLRTRAALDWTIVRPGRLVNEPGAGRVRLAEATGSGEVSREDVAAVLLALLGEPATAGRTLELIAGDTPIDRAVRDVATAA